MERWKCCACISQDDCTDISNKCCRACCICKCNTVVAWVRIGNPWIFARCFPVKVAAVNDDTADSCTMAADKFCCWMNNDICTVFDRTNQIRCCKCWINNQWNVMFMSNFRQFLNIYKIWIRITKCLYINCFCIFLDCCFKWTFNLRINKCCRDVVSQRKCMSQKVVGSAINCFRCDDMFTIFCKCLNGIINRCCAGCNS